MKKYNKIITFGGFDTCHIGHIRLLKRAKGLCNKLIVCVDTDNYMIKRKHVKPIVQFKSRKELLRSIKYIDKVDRQDLTFSKKNAIKKHKPDAIVVGSDHKNTNWDGENLGIPVIYLSRTKGISSTMLRNKRNVK